MSGLSKSTEIAALSEKNVSDIAELSLGQLRAWDKRKFFQPQYITGSPGQSFARVYSFKDAVGLRTISVLRKEYKISTQKLFKVAAELERRGFSHWADTTIYVLKGEVYFKHPNSSVVEGLESGQLAMLEVIDVIQDVEARIVRLKARQPEQVGLIEKQRYVARNSSVVAGTRIPTATIMRFHQAGFTAEQIVKEYPSLEVDDVEAAILHEIELKQPA